MGIGRGSSSSKRVRYVHSSNTKKGRIDVEKTLNKRGVRNYQANVLAKLQSKVDGEFCLYISVSITHLPYSYERRRAHGIRCRTGHS